MNSRMKALAILLLSLVSAGQASGAIPNSLSAALEKHGCLEIVNYADFMNIRGSWWVPLKQFTGAETDFAFYCQDKTDRMSTRLIVDVKGDLNPWKDCSQTVDTWQGVAKPHLPIDLEVIPTSARYTRISDLGRWWLVSSSRDLPVTHGPAGTQAPDLVIDTTGQSAGGVYACHAGKWYTIGLD